MYLNMIKMSYKCLCKIYFNTHTECDNWKLLAAPFSFDLNLYQAFVRENLNFWGHSGDLAMCIRHNGPKYFFNSHFIFEHSPPIIHILKVIIEMVFCYQNCSDLLWEKIVLVTEIFFLKFEGEGWEFGKLF